MAELPVELSTRLSGRRSRRSRWDTTERSPGGGRRQAERVPGDVKTRELEHRLSLRLLIDQTLCQIDIEEIVLMY